MTTAIQLHQDMPLTQIGDIFAKSGFFADSKDAAQAIVKVMAGAEMGFPPVASMTGVYIVKGKPSLSASMMASMVKRSGKYNYRVKTLTDELAEIEFFEQGQSIGVSSFSIQDAKKAGTQNTDRYPRNMLFARAMSNGVKWFCPDLFGGPIYTPDELGARVDDDGNMIEQAPTATPSPTVETDSGEKVDTETGEVVEEKKEKPIWRYLRKCQELKSALGEDAYYSILREFDMRHANEVDADDTATMCAIVKSLEAELTARAIEVEAA